MLVLEVITTMGGDTALEEQRFPNGDASVKNSRAESDGKKSPMRLISGEELKEKLDQKEDFKLVFVLSEWQYRAMHIPGSLNLYKPDEALKVLDQDDEIVVYCSNEACAASRFAYHFLVNHGFKNVRRYAGGLLDWLNAGYPLEGERLN